MGQSTMCWKQAPAGGESNEQCGAGERIEPRDCRKADGNQVICDHPVAAHGTDLVGQPVRWLLATSRVGHTKLLL